MLDLPHFDHTAQSDPPHRRRVIASHTSEDGKLYQVCENWPRTKWWVSCVKSGLRMSCTLSTTSPRVKQEWVLAVETGQVRLNRFG